MDCRERAGSEVAEDYVAGHLSGPEKEAFELHFFECPECLAQVRALQLSKVALEEDESLRGEAPAPKEATVRWPWWTALAAAAALAVVVIGLRWSGPAELPADSVAMDRQEAPTTGRQSAESESAVGSEAEITAEDVVAEAGREANKEILLASLAAVEPAPFERVVLRGVADEASRQFDRGMEAYLEGDFELACGFLQSAAASDPGRPDIAFYCGVSLLLAGSTEDAIAELKRTVDLEDPVFSEEARYYLAKAHLRAGDLATARGELTRVIDTGGPLATEAAEILQQIQSLP